MSSKVLIIRSTSTGAGITGLSLTLRVAPYTADLLSASEVPGKAGAYQFTITQCLSAVKLFQDGVEDKSFGGDNGTDILENSDVVHKSGDETIDGNKSFSNPLTVAAPASANHAVTRTYAESNFLALTGDQTVGGNKGFSNPLTVAAPASANHAVNLATADLRYILSAKSIVVDSNLSADVTGVKYAKIQDAINYAQSQTPSSSNRFSVFIVPSKNSSGYSENLTLQPYVDLIGIGLVKISGSISGASANTSVYNIFLSYDGNLSITSLKAFNSIFKSFQSTPNGGYTLSVSASTLMNCFLIATAGSDPKIISGGNNIFINCTANKFSGPAASDKGVVNDLMDSTITL